MNPLADLAYLAALIGIFRRIRPDVVHAMTTKPNVYASIAARFVGVPRVVCSVEGLGHAFSEVDTRYLRAVRAATMFLYRVAGKAAHRVRFMNPDDSAFFLKNRLVAKEKAVLIVSEGVDLTEYGPFVLSPDRRAALRAEWSEGKERLLVIMAARANWLKGVEDFIQASETLRSEIPRALFLLFGGIDEGPQAVSQEYLEAKRSDHFRWLGWWSDLREVFACADIVVLPSRMREGVPSTLLEAMAFSVPIVTTDTVGCREVVADRKNGFLVKPGDVNGLAAAISRLCQDDTLRAQQGQESRVRVEQAFDQKDICSRIFTELYS
jgi:glycosyltransferase involved in cell wall biosynthesis